MCACACVYVCVYACTCVRACFCNNLGVCSFWMLAMYCYIFPSYQGYSMLKSKNELSVLLFSIGWDHFVRAGVVVFNLCFIWLTYGRKNAQKHFCYHKFWAIAKNKCM